MGRIYLSPNQTNKKGTPTPDKSSDRKLHHYVCREHTNRKEGVELQER
jgi:hypothetical protein